MNRLCLVVMGLCLGVSSLYAQYSHFDIYGVDEGTQNNISKVCAPLVERYVAEFQRAYAAEKPPNKVKLVQLIRMQERILKKVHTMGDFALAKLSVVQYPSNNRFYATLDLVRVQDVDRLPPEKFRPRQSLRLSSSLKKLISMWNNYEAYHMRLVRLNQLDLSHKTCPTTHCTWGFDPKERRHLLPQIQEGVRHHQQELKHILQAEKDDGLRAQALFLLGHDPHYQTLIPLLMLYVDDSSDEVRNNALRVLGAIAAKHTIPKSHVVEIIKILNYPYVTDRNKAAFILLGVVQNDPAMRSFISREAGPTLLRLLKLKQPNNHDIAYRILTLISHRHYGEYDESRWRSWLVSVLHAPSAREKNRRTHG